MTTTHSHLSTAVASPRRSAVTRGAAAVARQALQGARPAAQAHPALVNGAAGALLTMDGRPYAVFAFTIAQGKIVRIDAVADPDRVARLAAPVLASAQLSPLTVKVDKQRGATMSD